jgi:hypothetical protein
MHFPFPLADKFVIQVYRAQKQPAMHGILFGISNLVPVKNLQLVGKKYNCLAFKFLGSKSFGMANPRHQHRPVVLPKKHPCPAAAVLSRFRGFKLVRVKPFQVLFC